LSSAKPNQKKFTDFAVFYFRPDSAPACNFVTLETSNVAWAVLQTQSRQLHDFLKEKQIRQVKVNLEMLWGTVDGARLPEKS